MASRLRIEYVTLNSELGRSNASNTIINSIIGAVDLACTTTVTASGSRPVVPSGANYALIRALDLAIIVAVGDNPTAVFTATGTPNDGVRLQANDQVAIAVRPGQKISAVECTS